MNHVALEQLQEFSAAASPDLDLSLLTGNWINTNPSPAFIRSIQLEPKQGQLMMHVTGTEPGFPEDWGTSEAQPFAENTTSRQAMAFSTTFDLGGAEILIQAYVVKGVLVIISFTLVKDGRQRSSSFGKEFFYRVP